MSLNDVNNNNTLNDEEYTHADDNINCKKQPIVIRIKNEQIKKTLKNRQLIRDLTITMALISAITKLNALLGKLLSNRGIDNFSLFFSIIFKMKNYLKSRKCKI